MRGNRGKRCAFCNRLDMLPQTCVVCLKAHCELCVDHGCERSDGRRLPSCPLCGSLVTLKAGESEDQAVSRHIDSGCTEALQAKENKQRRSESRCAFGPCKDAGLIKVQCARCLKKF